MLNHELDVFRRDRAAAFLQARFTQIKMRETTESRFRKRAAGTRFRTPINEQNAVCDLRVKGNIRIPRSNAGQARHRPKALLTKLPCRAIREFPNVCRSRTNKNQIDFFTSIHGVVHSSKSSFNPAWAWKHTPGNSFQRRAVAANPVQWQKPSRSGAKAFSAAMVLFMRSGDAASK